MTKAAQLERELTPEEQSFGPIEWDDLESVTTHICRARSAGERDYITNVLAALVQHTRQPEVLPEGASIVKYTVRIGVPINSKPSDPKIIWQSPIRFVDGEGRYEQEAVLAALAKLEEGK